MSCGEPPSQTHGHRDETHCAQTYFYKGTCQYVCDAGYQLESGGVDLLTCVPSTISGTDNVKWDKVPSPCKGSTLTTVHANSQTKVDYLNIHN